MSSAVSPRTAAAVVVVSVAIFGAIGIFRVLDHDESAGQLTPPRDPLHVPLWVPPGEVEQRSRFLFTFDPPEALAPLRLEEGLDEVVMGATSQEEKVLRLMHWARALFEPGRPDPYPPPDARIILHDIRAGRTGGFCAQYCFILVQAAGSFGIPARMVTIQGHEVCEAWLADQRRWVIFDPLYSLQVTDPSGRSLSALQIHRGVASGSALRLTPGHSYPGPEQEYLDRYGLFAVWLRNDLVSRPLNFADFTRFRLWFDPSPETVIPSQALFTRSEIDLYPPLP